MKNVLRIAGILLLVSTFSLGTHAQSRAKFGYIDSEKLLSMMPERAKAQKELQDFAKGLEDQLASMNSELQQKYNEYMQKKDSLSDFLRQTKEKEIQDLQARIQNFQMTAQQELQKKEQELVQPIVEKAKAAIKKVAKAKGFTYIFDVSTGAFLYWPEGGSEDILPLVKKELGIE